ncbi:MAG: hypothetical protein HY287_02400 [Planctomycetes bacterium]|nr:hypothetical protein [Planctomycetota bacterium]MBI3833160.1 hypothetical protein [Planctomycetota bacterium]
MNRLSKAIVLSALILTIAGQSKADIIVPGADGSDGPLNCGTLAGLNPDWACGVACPTTAPVTYTIDLSRAVPLTWDMASPLATRGRGVYDYNKWAVVFKYSCIDIPANVTIVFKNHPSRAPVVWLVSGDVNIAGTISLDGQPGTFGVSTFAEPGPGGFRGGSQYLSEASPQSAGLGPGGAPFCQEYPSFAVQYGNVNANCAEPPIYGNSRVVPLIGGSGGVHYAGPGGGGGGAILIASKSTITLSGLISSDGGHTGLQGTGGAIRLIADVVRDAPLPNMVGRLRAGDVLQGRIRVEANTRQLADLGSPPYTVDISGTTASLWPDDTAPTVRLKTIGGQLVNTDPRASLDIPGADVTVPNQGSQLVVIEAENVPLDWAVVVRMVPRQGADLTAQAAYLSGTEALSTWYATLPVPSGFSVLQARAYKPTAETANAEGEPDANGLNR